MNSLQLIKVILFRLSSNFEYDKDLKSYFIGENLAISLNKTDKKTIDIDFENESKLNSYLGLSTKELSIFVRCFKSFLGCLDEHKNKFSSNYVWDGSKTFWFSKKEKQIIKKCLKNILSNYYKQPK